MVRNLRGALATACDGPLKTGSGRSHRHEAAVDMYVPELQWRHQGVGGAVAPDRPVSPGTHGMFRRTVVRSGMQGGTIRSPELG